MTYSKAICPTLLDFTRNLLFIFCLSLFGAGCATSQFNNTLPPALAENIESTLTFPEIQESPDSFQGKLVLLGGQILEARRLKDSTQLTILQLPLINEQKPTPELTQSQGRFIAEQQEFLDPATVPPGTRVTVVGELTGSVRRNLDETMYTYPTLIIKDLKVWPDSSSDFDRYGSSYQQRLLYPHPYGFPYRGRFSRFHPFHPYWYW
jgi:outer membrane lipoprotein